MWLCVYPCPSCVHHRRVSQGKWIKHVLYCRATGQRTALIRQVEVDMAEVPRVEGMGRANLAPGQTMAVAVAAAMAIREGLMVEAAVRVSQHHILHLCVLSAGQ